MIRKSSIKFFIAGLMILSISACEKPKIPGGPELSEAHKTLARICSEFKPAAVSTPLQNTVWIYAPLTEDIFKIKASNAPSSDPTQGGEVFLLLYKDVNFEGDTIKVKYDIDPSRLYHEDPGYGNSYNEPFLIKNQAVIDAVRRSYFDINEESGEKAPEFIVIVIADIKNGIAIESISNFNDFKRSHNPAPTLAQDEYAKRTISRVYGSKDLIGDFKGENVEKREITWREFVVRQIRNRIQFKYKQSDFKPTEKSHAEILKAVAQTTSAYEFDDFDSVMVEDISAGEMKNYAKSALPEVSTGSSRRFRVQNFDGAAPDFKTAVDE